MNYFIEPTMIQARSANRKIYKFVRTDFNALSVRSKKWSFVHVGIRHDSEQ